LQNQIVFGRGLYRSKISEFQAHGPWNLRVERRESREEGLWMHTRSSLSSVLALLALLAFSCLSI